MSKKKKSETAAANAQQDQGQQKQKQQKQQQEEKQEKQEKQQKASHNNAPVKVSDPNLRKQIREELRSLHQQKKPLDRTAIKAKFCARSPSMAHYINTIVEDFSTHLEGKPSKKAKKAKQSKGAAQAKGSPDIKPKQPASPTKTTAVAKKSHTKATVQVEEDLDSNDGISVGEQRDDSGSFDLVDLEGETEGEDSDNAILQDFKQHLAAHSGGAGRDHHSADALPSVPSLEDQMQFLNYSDNDDELTSGPLATNLNHSVLLSPAAEDAGLKLPSQFALLGKLATSHGKQTSDARVMLNSNIPFSAFVCGLQGSGKSHTTSCIIENCSMPFPALGRLKKSVSTLVLHFNEYSSNVSSQPSEAAFLASVMPEYAAHLKPIPLRVLVSPTNFRNLEKMYSQIPNVEVRPFKLQPRHLNISMMLSLMSMSQSDSMPLYMAQVTRVLRVMAMESGGHFDYADFRTRLSSLRLDRAQTPFLYQRLDLLDSYLDLTGEIAGDYFVDGGVTILDLSCPFVDQSTACILFRIAIDLFLYAHPARGKMIVADEAHKYMTDTAAAKELTETFLTIIRQQRHLGVRTVISTQEPTISPKLIDLCSVTIVHRFTSPEWYRAIQNHVPIDKSKRSGNEEGIPDGLYSIASLRTGEALVFAPSAHLLGEDEVPLDTKHRMFKMTVRKRITWDGGRTITTIR